MKWLGYLLLALAVGWLAWPRSGGKLESEKLVESSRRGLDREWWEEREGKMTLREMERYAAGLSDRELWEELGKVCDDWLAANAGSKRFEQPRLAIMLAREVGKRDGESGMKRVATWLKGRDEGLFEAGKDDLKMEFQFLEVRVRVASYAGWISEDPEAAISRLIESRKNEEEDWPVINQGFWIYFRVPEYFAMEEVLREGFRDLRNRDYERARELLVPGTGVWAFDLNVVVESFLSDMPKEKWPDFLATLSDEVGEHHGEVLEDGSIDSMWVLFREKNWGPGYANLFSQEAENDRHEGLDLWTFARTRPDEAALALRNEKVSQDRKKLLFLGMVLTDSQHFGRLGHLDDERKIDSVWFLMHGTQQYVFGPLTGKENPGELDRDHLMSVIGETSMSDETRGRLRELMTD